MNTSDSVSISVRITACLKRAIHKSVRMTIWLAKIILPVSLLVRILDYMGILTYVAEYATPLFKAMGLSGESSIVFLSSIFLPLYAPIAIMSSLPLTMREVTILSLMCLTSHNLPVESAIQKKTGSSFFRIAFFRIIMALVMGVFLNQVLPADGYPSWITTGTNETASTFGTLLEGWACASAKLIGVLLLVLSGLMLLQQIL
ncbi:MAG: nucleoside recognition domain-containing protein, partial [Bacteroidales bacterium]